MSEWNTIYNNSNDVVGTFRNGVAWSKPGNERIGKYDEEFVYDNKSEVLGKISDNVVVDIIGGTIGHVSGNELFLSDEKVGTFVGSTSAGGAAIVLIFSRYASGNT